MEGAQPFGVRTFAHQQKGIETHVRTRRGNLLHLAHRQMPRENDPIDALMMVKLHGLAVHQVRQCAGMILQARMSAAQDTQQTQVCENDAVDAGIHRLVDHGEKKRKLLIRIKGRVQGQGKGLARTVDNPDRLRQFIERTELGLGEGPLVGGPEQTETLMPVNRDVTAVKLVGTRLQEGRNFVGRIDGGDDAQTHPLPSRARHIWSRR